MKLSHFYDGKMKRPLPDGGMVRYFLEKPDRYIGFQVQIIKGNKRYRIAIRISRKYLMVVILEIKEKSLYIITAWNTNKKWQRKMAG